MGEAVCLCTISATTCGLKVRMPGEYHYQQHQKSERLLFKVVQRHQNKLPASKDHRCSHSMQQSAEQTPTCLLS
jgi:hypothetical protein